MRIGKSTGGFYPQPGLDEEGLERGLPAGRADPSRVIVPVLLPLHPYLPLRFLFPTRAFGQSYRSEALAKYFAAKIV